jgi:hypothetical protein
MCWLKNIIHFRCFSNAQQRYYYVPHLFDGTDNVDYRFHLGRVQKILKTCFRVRNTRNDAAQQYDDYVNSTANNNALLFLSGITTK